jgi:hypothetical protein
MQRAFQSGRDEIEARFYGHAIDAIIQDAESGRWYATNEKYITAITFCPFCGQRLVTNGR